MVNPTTNSNTQDAAGVGVTELACGALAVLALVGTWGQNIQYLHLGFAQANLTFWLDTLVNPASRSITMDLFALVLPVAYWMFSEARRLSMPGIWLYVLASFVIAISVALPVFIIHRARVVRRVGAVASVPLSGTDRAGMALLTVIALAYLALSFKLFG
jgi:hypothetical protein